MAALTVVKRRRETVAALTVVKRQGETGIGIDGVVEVISVNT